MNDFKGAVISAKQSLEKTINNLLEEAIDKGVFSGILIPMRVPAGDSFAYVLIKDKSLLKDASFLPPTMFVQGARAQRIGREERYHGELLS